MGGFAEDALLAHEVTRERGDIDLLVPDERWDESLEALEALGISDFEGQLPGPDGRPFVLVSKSSGIDIELWRANRTEEGYALVLPGAAGFFSLRLPADTFSHPPSPLQGISVQTVSPLALCLLRATSARTRGDATKRQADLEMEAKLSEAFLAGMKAEDLEPQIRPLP
jgi:hypothetical protein